MDQLIDNRGDYYLDDKLPPWQDLFPNLEFCEFVKTHCNQAEAILEIGSGLGNEALHLAREKLPIIASDISESALSQIKDLANQDHVGIRTLEFDIMACGSHTERYDAVFDKGGLHSFFTVSSRSRFAESVHSLLNKSGIWVSSVGSSEEEDSVENQNSGAYPRFTLDDIFCAIDPYFDVIEIRKGIFGNSELTSFKTWECAFRKR